MSIKKEYVIVKDRFPRFSEVLNDCVGNLCVGTVMNESLTSVLKKICAKITAVEKDDSCCYTFEDSDTVSFSVSGSNVVTADVASSVLTVDLTPVAGGVENGIYFQNESNQFSQSSAFTWDQSSKVLKISNGTNTITGGTDPIVLIDAGTNSYATEFKGNGSFTGILISTTGGANVPFIQMLNIGNSKYWTLTLDTDNGFNLREGTAGGTSRMKFAVGGDATFSSKVNGDSLRVRTASTVTTSTDTGTTGDIRWDANFFYICISTNVWKRASLSTW